LAVNSASAIPLEESEASQIATIGGAEYEYQLLGGNTGSRPKFNSLIGRMRDDVIRDGAGARQACSRSWRNGWRHKGKWQQDR
jgi:hypothetical protein